MGCAKDPDESTRKLYAKMAAEADAHSSDAAAGADLLGKAKALGYTQEEIRSVPDGAAATLGCGNPTALAQLKEGETVLDLGSGAGLDALLAARKVGPNGKVIGVDMTPEMVDRARQAAREGGYTNVEFRLGRIEKLPVEDASVDAIISNCVMNHCPDKRAAFREAWRVLRPGGRLHVSDLVIQGAVPPADAPGLEVWAEWLALAAGKREYLAAIAKAGFREVTVMREHAYSGAAMAEPLAGKIVVLHVTALR